MKLKSGHEVVGLPDAEQKEQADLFLGYSEGLIELHPGRWIFTKAFEKFADKIYEFEFKPSDVVIVTFPKCGTTWMQEIIWTMMKNINFDNEDSSFPVNVKCPFIEFDVLRSAPNCSGLDEDPFLQQYLLKYDKGIIHEDAPSLKLAKCAQEPRVLKTHLPFTLLNPKMLDICKVVYVVRNPKDVLVSFYHHSRVIRLHDYLGDFDKFFDLFVNDKVVYGPMWNFFKEGWERRNHPNLHLVYFEDLKVDSYKEIKRLDHFLGTNRSDEQIHKVMDHTSFKNMKERDAFASAPGDTPCELLNKDKGDFFRKGEAGVWKAEFSKEQNEIMDKWIEEHLKEAPFDFKYSTGS